MEYIGLPRVLKIFQLDIQGAGLFDQDLQGAQLLFTKSKGYLNIQELPKTFQLEIQVVNDI